MTHVKGRNYVLLYLRIEEHRTMPSITSTTLTCLLSYRKTFIFFFVYIYIKIYSSRTSIMVGRFFDIILTRRTYRNIKNAHDTTVSLCTKDDRRLDEKPKDILSHHVRSPLCLSLDLSLCPISPSSFETIVF
jgi:hypothetical protein